MLLPVDSKRGVRGVSTSGEQTVPCGGQRGAGVTHEPGGQRPDLSEEASLTSPAMKAKFGNPRLPAAEMEALVLSHAVHPSRTQGSGFRQLRRCR